MQTISLPVECTQWLKTEEWVQQVGAVLIFQHTEEETVNDKVHCISLNV